MNHAHTHIHSIQSHTQSRQLVNFTLHKGVKSIASILNTITLQRTVDKKTHTGIKTAVHHHKWCVLFNKMSRLQYVHLQSGQAWALTTWWEFMKQFNRFLFVVKVLQLWSKHIIIIIINPFSESQQVDQVLKDSTTCGNKGTLLLWGNENTPTPFCLYATFPCSQR